MISTISSFPFYVLLMKTVWYSAVLSITLGVLSGQVLGDCSPRRTLQLPNPQHDSSKSTSVFRTKQIPVELYLIQEGTWACEYFIAGGWKGHDAFAKVRAGRDRQVFHETHEQKQEATGLLRINELLEEFKDENGQLWTVGIQHPGKHITRTDAWKKGTVRAPNVTSSRCREFMETLYTFIAKSQMSYVEKYSVRHPEPANFHNVLFLEDKNGITSATLVNWLGSIETSATDLGTLDELVKEIKKTTNLPSDDTLLFPGVCRSITKWQGNWADTVMAHRRVVSYGGLKDIE